MRITTIRDGASWRHALNDCGVYDFYHTWDFHVISRNNGEGSPVMFVAEHEGGGMILPLLERNIPGTDWLDLTSVYGYPSPLTYGLVPRPGDVCSLWKGIAGFLREAGYVSMFSRGHPTLTPEALRGEYFKPIGDVVYINCSGAEEEQFRKYRRNHRQDIKKLRAMGVACKRGDGPESVLKFKRNYEATMGDLKAKDYYFFSDEYYEGLLSASDFDSEIWLAELDGEVLGGGFIIYCGDFVQYYLSGTNPKYHKLASSKLLIDNARQMAVKNGKACLVLGGGYGSRSDNLLNFKKGFSDDVEKFYVAKIVLDEKRYDDLARGREASFFPIYRARAEECMLRVRDADAACGAGAVFPGAALAA